jgi:hypothetical protein
MRCGPADVTHRAARASDGQSPRRQDTCHPDDRPAGAGISWGISWPRVSLRSRPGAERAPPPLDENASALVSGFVGHTAYSLHELRATTGRSRCCRTTGMRALRRRDLAAPICTTPVRRPMPADARLPLDIRPRRSRIGHRWASAQRCGTRRDGWSNRRGPRWRHCSGSAPGCIDHPAPDLMVFRAFMGDVTFSGQPSYCLPDRGRAAVLQACRLATGFCWLGRGPAGARPDGAPDTGFGFLHPPPAQGMSVALEMSSPPPLVIAAGPSSGCRTRRSFCRLLVHGPEDLLVDLAVDSAPKRPASASIAGPTFAPDELAGRTGRT